MKIGPTTRDGGDAHGSPAPYPDTGDDTGAGSERGATTGTPRWVKVFGIIVAIGLVLLFVVLHLTGIVGPGAQ